MSERNLVKISWMPEYENVRSFMRIIDGIELITFKSMKNAINELAKEVDLTNPDNWIDRITDETSKQLAKKVWEASGRRINPSRTGAEHAFAREYKLLTDLDIYRITENGQRFLKQTEGDLTKEIDRIEGFEVILTKLILNGVCKSSDLSEDFENFLAENMEKKPKTTYQYLLSRLQNLVSRGYVNNQGNFYDISTVGRRYFESLNPANKSYLFLKEITNNNESVEKRLLDTLQKLDDQIFEAIISELLKRMGYKTVINRQHTHDEGIDITAIKDFGFGDEMVVIQAKRHRNKINRTVVMQFKGDIRNFKKDLPVSRGIIIITSEFTPDAIENATINGDVPIVLINGEQLFKLLLEYQIGITKHSTPIFQFEPQHFVLGFFDKTDKSEFVDESISD